MVTRKVRAALEEVMEQLRQLPNRVRQYEAYVALQNKVRRTAHSPLTHVCGCRGLGRHYTTERPRARGQEAALTQQEAPTVIVRARPPPDSLLALGMHVVWGG